MNIYYIDYENVSSQGLKGVEALTENDVVNLLYSKKADNVKIEILTMLMASKAKIHFLPVHVGTPNALDFQLVTLLFLNYRPEDYCYIISKDSGYDCCIKTAAENGAPNVARYPNIESALNKVPAKKTRRGRRTEKDSEPSSSISAEEESTLSASPQPDPSQDAACVQENDSHIQDETVKKKASRRRGKKKGPVSESEQEEVLKPSAGETPASRDSESGKNPIPENAESDQKKGSEKAGSEKKHTADKSEAGKKQPLNAEKSESGKNQAQNAEKTEPGKNQAQNAEKSESGKKQAQNAEKSESGKKHIPEDAPGSSDSSKAAKTPDKESKPEMEKSAEAGAYSEHNPKEHVLSQRYLSNRFDQRNPLIISSGARSDADKPVSILSVIRRRNDVQLDMHQIDLIRDALRNSGNKQQFYSYFVKKLGQKQGIDLYQSVKSSYTDLINANLL